jgi:hypothetical protein
MQHENISKKKAPGLANPRLKGETLMAKPAAATQPVMDIL